MKPFHHLKLPFLILLLLAWVSNPVLRADEPSPAPDTATAPVAPEAPAAPDKSEEAPATPADADQADDDDDAKAPAAVASDADSASEHPDGRRDWRHGHKRNGANERVTVGGDSTAVAGERVQAVVSIFGSSTSAADVDDAVVSVGGGSRVTGGTVGDSVVSIMGNTYVNGHVRGEVVTIMGSAEFGPDAVVDGEVVIVGGALKKHPNAVLKSDVKNIGVLGRHFDFTGLTTWIRECLMWGRPLAFHRDLWWAWGVAFAFLAFYVLVAAIAPSGVARCMQTLEQRPGASLLTALLTLILTPVAYILLLVTVFLAVGAVLIPAFSIGLFFASVFGKIVMLAWLGRRLTNLSGSSALSHPALGVLLGGVIVLGLYTVPIGGFILMKLLGIVGLGVVVLTLIQAFQASRPPKPAPAPRGVVPSAPIVGAVPVPPPAASDAGVPPPLASMAPPVVSAATLPRAGFWLRVGAALLDVILIGIASGLSEGVFRFINFHPGGAFPFWLAVYCAVMWATKGTTIGGIICGLKVVRLDDRPVDWGVAIVRALSAFLSLAVAGLGFIWVAFDDEKQSWHDKIAGTTIVKVPKGTALL